MATIAENLLTIKDSTDAIKLAIIDKGGTIEGDITTWANSIANIISGGSSDLGFLTKADLISNKLEGSTVDCTGYYSSVEKVIYNYNVVYGDYTLPLILNLTKYIDGTNILAYPEYSHVYLAADRTLVSSINAYGKIYRDGTLSIYYSQDFTTNNLDSNLDVYIIIFFIDHYNKQYDFDYCKLYIGRYTCFAKNTPISLSNGIIKLIQDINYNDELLVWNFDEGKFDKAKPLWIKKTETSNFYYKVTLDNGTILKLVGSNDKCHRLFNYDDLLFESATDLVGKNVHTLTGITKVVSVEKIKETCEYYNLITDYYMNCYANGVLTSCRYNNLYPIKNMKFDKSLVKLEPRYKIHAEKFHPNPEILPKYIKGMRLDENTTIPIEEMKSYISNLEKLRKNIDDFEENQEMVESVEEAGVGWIDPEGNVYGYRLYMPGQMNHITLADKICKKLGYKEQKQGGYSKTLEDLGWCKFTDEFLLTTSYLTDRQEHKLAKFITNNPKVKKRGTIKLGTMFSESTNIENIKKMSKKDLTNKMRGHDNKKN